VWLSYTAARTSQPSWRGDRITQMGERGGEMLKKLVVAGTLALALPVAAAAQAPTPYGAPITLEQARTVAAAAEAEAIKTQWPVVVVIVDTGGHLVLVHRLDNTQIGSVDVAVKKAVS